jgi:hypothetical protein
VDQLATVSVSDCIVSNSRAFRAEMDRKSKGCDLIQKTFQGFFFERLKKTKKVLTMDSIVVAFNPGIFYINCTVHPPVAPGFMSRDMHL